MKHDSDAVANPSGTPALGDSSPGPSKGAKLTVFTLAIMNVTAVVSLRGLPAEAEYGLSAIFYYLFAAVFFLVPVSIVAAELATGWPQKGGIFRWVGEAFGTRIAFLAMFMLWAEVTIWFPTVLTFAGVSLAFMGPDQTWDQGLATNKYYTLGIVLAVYWLATFIAMKGTAFFARVAKWGGIVGTIIPAVILIVLGIAYFVTTGDSQITLAWGDVIPDFSNFKNLVLAASIFLFYAGMEMNAVHVQEVDDPARNYPKAILISSIATVAIFVLGTLAIAIIIPNSQINLVQSLLVSYDDFFAHFGIGFLAPVIAAMLAFGVLGGVTVWVAGPSAGLLQVGKAGFLPRGLQKTNAAGAPVNLLYLQAGIVSVLALAFVVLPSVQATYQILSQLTVILYLIMYLLMFASALWLRRTQPDTPRPYKVPGGKAGMWVFAGAGFLGSLLAFVLSFVPPSQVAVGSPTLYVGLLVLGTVVFVGLPFLIYKLRRPTWRAENSDFEPFSWEKKSATSPATPATAASPAVPASPAAPASSSPKA
ncbi:amino acid permease [Rubrivirga sp. S365]|uniref:putative glutamine/gamma-aminobutyrate antiporter GadC n=1 Tax=Rubrivirga sp. S365 TaxID=3076080 RepID=UPI0028C92559|nr:putative glutamine/gamma-aminobutyrate antiporter GadC [Rubrivirga sp. S365]MDT7858340.1 amino acid permease [Rubrivirga sp. S365]